MGTYRCIRCTGSGEFADKDEAIRRLDHALGIYKGRPCAGGKDAPIQEVTDVVNPPPKAEPQAKAEKPTEKPTKSKASEK